MAQLTVYVDSGTRSRIEVAARNARASVSQWVKERLTEALERDWPENYFEVLGSLADTDLQRPAQTVRKKDVRRERL